MGRLDDESKQNRKELVFRTVLSEGSIKEIDLAGILQINQRTVNNYLRDLERENRVGKDGLCWQVTDFGTRQLRRIEITPEEGMALYLAARSLARVQDERNEIVESALYKLANAIKDDVILGHAMTQAAQELADRPERTGYNQVFRTLMQSYVYRRAVKITYAPASGKAFETVFKPYLFEPSLFGLSVYAIGHSSIVNALRNYKIERILSASMAVPAESYAIPDDFSGLAMLKTGWSGMFGEKTQLVRLRFSPNVRKRVLETHWHGSQKTYDDAIDARYLIWEAHMSDWLDMLPWAKGWGGEVEILHPPEMRVAVMREVRKMMGVYGVEGRNIDPVTARLLRCWGKTASQGVFHPALFHMLDVGHVAQVLLGDSASPRWRNILRGVFGWDDATLQAWIPLFVALHDIGKISASFASLNMQQKERMQREGFNFGKWTESLNEAHGLIGQVVLGDVLTSVKIILSEMTRKIVEEVIGGHHGEFTKVQSIKKFRQVLAEGYEAPEWSELRRRAGQLLATHFCRDVAIILPEPLNVSGAVAALTGFTILCDWLGSDSAYFLPQPEMEIDLYLLDSQSRAQKVVRAAGFMQTVSSPVPTSVQILFPNLNPIRPLQAAINDIPELFLMKPCLAIIEAPTGEGKTEAAMALAHRIARAQGTDELYCALPTMATSNQMFGRMQHYLRDHLHLDANVSLVHGQAFLVEDELQIKPLDNGDGKTQREGIEWFSSKKRALLAPFGVGTVDQSELAALNVRHNMLRLIGLAGKVIILDEVHAYDTYMSTIIERLLQWLSTLGSSVILLSATLPMRQRLLLAQAYGAIEPNKLPDSYPSVIIANKGTAIHSQSPSAWQPNRQISISAMCIADIDPIQEAQEKARWLLDAVKDGGCACWMCNTVDRAQKIYEALDAIAIDTVNLVLLHARFPLDQRQKIETELAALYGRDGNRPMHGIVVGTQVLEQSLDLDFDIMVTDLPPIDLLLQRAGRLHRHTRVRPAKHHQPMLYVNTPLHIDEAASLGSDAFIYAEYLLRQTWRILALPCILGLPRDYRPLVEAVYGNAPSKDDALFAVWQKMVIKQTKDKQEAELRLLPAPKYDESFVAEATRLTFDENENSAAWIVAQTRLGEESLNIIPIAQVDDKYVKLIVNTDEQLIELGKKADHDIALRLLRGNMRISNYDAVVGIRNAANAHPHKLFTDTALLKGYLPLMLVDRHASFMTKNGVLDLYLHPKLGLVINKNKKGE